MTGLLAVDGCSFSSAFDSTGFSGLSPGKYNGPFCPQAVIEPVKNNTAIRGETLKMRDLSRLVMFLLYLF